jgi:hypothetical protein
LSEFQAGGFQTLTIFHIYKHMLLSYINSMANINVTEKHTLVDMKYG